MIDDLNFLATTTTLIVNNNSVAREWRQSDQFAIFVWVLSFL